MITVLCVWVEANVPYGPEYVINLRRMVERQLALPHRFVCLTDRPEHLDAFGYPGIEWVRIPKPCGRAGWWSKLEVFNPMHQDVISGTRLYLDLDVLVVGDLARAVWWHERATLPLALCQHEGDFNGRNGLKVLKAYNSSVMVWNGNESALYAEWTPGVARRLWGDQDWIAEQRPGLPTFPREWFPRISAIQGDSGKLGDAIAVLCKRPKNSEAAERWPWVKEAWR